MQKKVILAETVVAYSNCPRKAFLLHCTEERGTPHKYQHLLEERTKLNRTQYLGSLRQRYTSICSYDDRGISSGVDVITEADLTAADVEASCDALTRVDVSGEKRSAWEPTLAVGTYSIEKEHVLHLAVAGHVLGQLQGKPPSAGHVVTADGGNGFSPICRIAPNSISRDSHRAESQARNMKIVSDQEFAGLFSECRVSLHRGLLILHMFPSPTMKIDVSTSSPLE
jgi:hypothetical protein